MAHTQKADAPYEQYQTTQYRKKSNQPGGNFQIAHLTALQSEHAVMPMKRCSTQSLEWEKDKIADDFMNVRGVAWIDGPIVMIKMIYLVESSKIAFLPFLNFPEYCRKHGLDFQETVTVDGGSA
ncbi:MAG: hypothetical protein M9929_16455 [Burkholderiaceae bacterium]|nr:hypothetical protein [Burkholderiaceae bacterium]